VGSPKDRPTITNARAIHDMRTADVTNHVAVKTFKHGPGLLLLLTSADSATSEPVRGRLCRTLL
jgi:hypothetical protein